MNKKLLSLIIFCSFFSKYGLADDYFNPNLIDGYNNENDTIDLSVFNKKDGQLPGDYFTNVYFNNDLVSRSNIKYENKDDSKLYPVLTKKDYISYGVLANATQKFSQLSDDDIVSNIADYIPDSSLNYDFNQGKLLLSVPQLYINSHNQSTESLWDNGVNAMFSNYYYAGATSKYKNLGTVNNSYLNLRNGINLGDWRLRNYTTYTHSNNEDKWNNISNYLERDIKSIKGQLVIGDSYTNSELFDSFSFRGVKIASDDSMLPLSERGFAPVIKGVAQGESEVIIKQSGFVIKRIYVPSGPFLIDDIYPTSSSGNLEVTIKPNNGVETTYIQPFSSLPIMLREGRFKYSLVAGQNRETNNKSNDADFAQLTGIYGFPYDLTGFGGGIFAKNYQSFLFGIGKSLGDFGSISTDITFAKTKRDNQNEVGHSYRIQYSKDVLDTGTSFSFVGYRYSTSDYNTFSESLEDDQYFSSNRNKKDKVEFNISQNLGENYGNFSLLGYQQKYWQSSNKVRTLNLGYYNSYKDISYSLNYIYSKSGLNGNDSSKILSLSMSIPFSSFMPKSNINTATSIDDNHKVNSSIGVSGYALDDNSLFYNVQTSYTSKQEDNEAAGVSLNYKTSFGEYSAGYNYSASSQQLNYSAGGSIVLHPYGITFARPLGDTSILVRTKDANNIKLNNNQGISTDYSGNAIIPYASPYQKNTVSLDNNSVTNHADILKSIETVVPTKGAIVLADFPVNIGYKALFQLNGMNIPFGANAEVENDEQISTGIIDDNQTVYLSGIPQKGVINIKWSGGSCEAPYEITDINAKINLLTIECK